MASLYISEYAHAESEFTIDAQVAMEPSIDQTPLAIGAATQSNAFAANTALIRVHVDAICSIKIGADPTATTANKRIAADQTEYFGVNPGDKLSVIANT